MVIPQSRIDASLPRVGERPGERAAPKVRSPRPTQRKRLSHAKALRSNQTDAENRLWHDLRAHRFLGLKFKRQKPIGPYIADFVCEEYKLIIELDGGQHSGQQAYDQRRTNYLAAKHFKVLRFWNNDVLQHTDSVLESIRLAVGEAALSPTPLPQAGEGTSK